jgi:Fe-S oxidoreductase
MDDRRQMPSFAPKSFQAWYGRRTPRNLDGPPVVLWPDTFNNHFHPGTAQAALEVLESAGFRVLVPQGSLCCGRPLYDYGMLDLARSQLRNVLDRLGPLIHSGVPLVGLEPSCVSVFRDELVEILPHDQDARRLRDQSFGLGEFLQRESYEPPRQLQRKAVVQGHCHQKAVLTTKADEAVLRSLGVDFKVLDAGCCGMAGAFGFEEGEHCDVSMAAGERVLLPAVRAVDRDTLVIADGFSCREQITQLTDRRPVHLAEVLRMALGGTTAT